jgi:hypothetical protein
MANTYTLIASSTVGAGGAATIDFTSIPATYTDLKLVSSLRSSVSATQGFFTVKLNSTNGSEYKALYGTGSAAGSDNSTSSVYGYSSANSSTSNTFNNVEIYIPNYTSSNAKSISMDSVSETNASAIQMNIVAGLYGSITSAVTSITLTNVNSDVAASGTFVQYSTAYLYGIKNS